MCRQICRRCAPSFLAWLLWVLAASWPVSMTTLVSVNSIHMVRFPDTRLGNLVKWYSVHICRPDLERCAPTLRPLWSTSRSSTTWTAGAPMDGASSPSSGKQLQPVLQGIWRNQTEIAWRNVTMTTCKTGVPIDRVSWFERFGEIKRTVEESQRKYLDNWRVQQTKLLQGEGAVASAWRNVTKCKD